MNRRWAAGLVAVLVAAGLGACGDGDDGRATDAGGRPLLPAASAGGATSESAAMAADSAERSMIAPARWREYRIAAGVEAPATEAPAYRLVPKAIDEDDITEALGDPEGTVDLQRGRWGFHRDVAGPDTAVISSKEMAACEAGDCTYEPPPPPPGVPSAAEAVARFTQILEDLDLDPSAGSFDHYDADGGPVYQRTVTFRPEVDGVPVLGLEQSIAFGEHGRVEWASGFAGHFEKLGDYPLVGLDEALERQQANEGTATDLGRVEPAIDPPAEAVDDAPAAGGGTSGSSGSGGSGTAGQTEPGNPGPEPSTIEPARPTEPVEPDAGPPSAPAEPEIVEVTGAELALLALWPRCEGDDLLLVPAFQLGVGDEVHLTLPAVDESSMARPDPDAPYEPCPGEEPMDEPVGRPEPAPRPPDAGGGEPARP